MMTDIETSRQVDKFKKKKRKKKRKKKKATIETLWNSRHFSSKFTYLHNNKN